MKGVIVTCLESLVEAKLGKAVWAKVAQQAGVSPTTLFLPAAEVDDATVVRLVQAVSKVAGMTREAALDAFGDYWINDYVVKYYAHFFRDRSSAKQFLLETEEIHALMTRSMPNAKPPHFKCTDTGPKSLVLEYSSHRGLADMVPGLIKGVARKYGERVSIKRQGTNRFEVTFA